MDESDEAHCRCAEPSVYFDCSAWNHTLRRSSSSSDSECVLRSVLCNGRAHCSNLVKEFPQICEYHTPQRGDLWSENYQGFLLLFVVGTLLLIFICSVCCCTCFAYQRSRKKGRYRRPRRVSNHSAELSLHFRGFPSSAAQTIAVSPAQYFDNSASVVEVALQPYPMQLYSEECPIYESATLPHVPTHLCSSLPRTHHHQRHHVQQNWKPAADFAQDGAGEALATFSNAPSSSFVLPAPSHTHLGRFHAPPPSAASISTYGIAKPGNALI